MEMEDRIKSGPFMPKWQKLKGRHKALGGKLFKPDLTPVIERYDQTLIDYVDATKEAEKLKDELSGLMKTSEESSKVIAGYAKELEQVTSKWRDGNSKHSDAVKKFSESGSGNLSDVESHLAELISLAEEYVDNRKELYDAIDGQAVQNLAVFKRTQKSFGDKAKAVYDKKYKISGEAIKAEVEAQEIIRSYIDIADDADHPEITKDLQSLKF